MHFIELKQSTIILSTHFINTFYCQNLGNNKKITENVLFNNMNNLKKQGISQHALNTIQNTHHRYIKYIKFY